MIKLFLVVVAGAVFGNLLYDMAKTLIPGYLDHIMENETLDLSGVDYGD